MTINELMTKRAQAWDACKTFLNDHRDERGLLNAEDEATYNRMEKDIDNYTHEIERQQRAEQIDKAMNEAVRQPIKNSPNGRTEGMTGRASNEYSDAFWKFMRMPHNAVPTPEIRNALTVGTDANGGYLVPEEFEKTLVQAIREQNIMRQLAHVIRTNSERAIPIQATATAADWTAEEGSYNESTPTFSQKVMGAHKLTVLTKISEELMADSAFNMAAFIAQDQGKAIADKEEAGFFTGNGTGKPTGILDATNGAGTGVTAAYQTAISFDEVIDLFYSVKSPYRKKAVFICHDSTAKALRKLKDLQNQYIWQPAVVAGQPDMILGRPVYTSANMPEMAAGKAAMLFGDMSYYWIGDRGTRSLQRLNELYATTGQIGFIASQRVDGMLVLPEAVKKLVMAAAPVDGGE